MMPGIRRLFDWRAGGFASISVLSIVPLLALVPALIALTYGGRLRLVDKRLVACAWVWTGGFSIAAVIGIANGVSPAAAGYAFAQFLLPAAFGLWIASLDMPADVLYHRIASIFLWLSTPLCLYAAFQFVSPPAWDVAWMHSAGILSIGKPFPYELRPFSTLNAPGVFADFLVITIALNLPRLIVARAPLRYAQFALCVAALVLTMVRTGWLGFVVALVTYFFLTPNRGRNLAVFSLIAVVGSLVVFNASALLGSEQAGNSIAARFSTLSNLGQDASFIDRQQYFGSVLYDAAAQPFGQGLGTIGTAAKLGSSGDTKDFDNGFIARFSEMGYFGTVCYLATVIAMGVLCIRAWQRYGARRESKLTAIAAAVVAVQVMLFVLDVASDHHNALAGLAFWISAAILYGRNESVHA